MNIARMIEEKNISRKILKRFVKDYKLPIKITHSPYFEYFCDLYKDVYDIKNPFNNLATALEDFETEEDFLDYCADVRKNMIDFIKEKEQFKFFTQINIKEFGEPIKILHKNDLYTSKNVGKKFMSIDLKKGNFQSIKQVAPDMFELDGDFTYEEFASKFTKYDYLINSKQFRQTVFGELSSKRQGAIQKVLMNKIKMVLESNKILDSSKLVQATNDELVYEIESDSSIENLKFVSEVCRLQLTIEQTIKKELNVDVKAESYELRSIKDSDKVFAKENIGEERFKLVNASSLDYAQYFKAYKNMPLNEYDLMFYHEHRLCKFMTPIFNKDDKCSKDNEVESTDIVCECTQCKNYESSVYLEMGDETLCNHWCSENEDVFKVYKEKRCKKFTKK